MKSSYRKPRPVIKLPRTTLDNYLETVSVLGLFAMVYLLARYWTGLPSIVPTHFGAAGQPDGWGSKTSLFVNLGLGLFFYLGLTVLYRFPHIYNYLYTINEANAQVQYRLARSLVSGLKAGVILIFTYGEWATIQTALGQSTGLGPWFVFIVMVFSLGPILFYLYKSYQAEHQA
ncbi:MAG: DUF1648 domain-containing protein [Syntrophomonadaceae bacterium]